MNATDVSSHGWPLGPVPIAVGIWSFVELVRILSRNKKPTASSVLAVYGLSPIIVTLGYFAMRVVARDDLSLRVLAIGSAFSVILALALHEWIGRISDATSLSAWFAFRKKVRSTRLVKGVFGALFLLSWPFVLFALFGPGSAECTTSRCRAGAILLGSNLSAGLLMWIVFTTSGLILPLFLASIYELARRAVAGNEPSRPD
jgi:hypothetical protein